LLAVGGGGSSSGESGDEEEVDVEECSDGEGRLAEEGRQEKNKVDDSGSEGSPASSRRRKGSASPAAAPPIPARCNCPELLGVECRLETKDLWDKFHDLGTEMIITKTGR
jgi:hypothetical protein